ncbi:MAG TPA: head GIN domain-containing protein [Phnomibacter sp.]|nr:head GIN domain-containing protein [Phnomibacter sp.]
MVRLFAALILPVVMLATGCRWRNTVNGNGVQVTEKRSVSGFNRITCSGPFDVDVTLGEPFGVVISADENLMDLIRADKDGKTLELDITDGYNVRSRNQIKILVSMPEAEALTCAGSGRITVQGTMRHPNELRFNVGGSGDILAEVNSPRVEAKIGGSGTIVLKGETRSLQVSIGGSGDFKGADLLSEETKVSVGGSGTARVYASKNLNVSVAGSGDIYYSGNPAVKQSIAGSGTVRKSE